MSKDHIRYDLLVQNALKGVVRKVLADSSRDGMPPDHHFYVSFRTDLAGTKVSSRLREKYPEEMTIVLQHQFWDLTVSENHFEVGLSFSGIPERLVVPFDSLTGFYDPSVEFGLKFEVKDDQDAADDMGDKPSPVAAIDENSANAPRLFTPRSLRDRATAAATDAAPDDGDVAVTDAVDTDAARKDAKAGVASQNNGAEAGNAEAGTADAAETPEAAGAQSGGAQVVSLDAFRKKH